MLSQHPNAHWRMARMARMVVLEWIGCTLQKSYIHVAVSEDRRRRVVRMRMRQMQ